MKRSVILCLAVLFLCAGTACAEPLPEKTEPAPAPSVFAQTSQALIENAIGLFGQYGAQKSGEVEAILDELTATDPDHGARWRDIFTCWQRFDGARFDTRLPEGLPDTDALCLVVLGFQLAPDGSMREELLERLGVALQCAEQYPNAYILCTGGHTAQEAKEASEAGRMAEWLISNGVAPARVMAEESSLTTTQNAEFTYSLLQNSCPAVTAVAVISSDYHVASGAVLLEAVSVLRAPTAEKAPFHVLACAACPRRQGSSRSFAQSGLRAFARQYG